jgi:hypothetical protein
VALKRTPSRWWDALILAAIGGCMTAWTWLTWPDILVDFGRELYVPWRLVAGADLYTDLAYFNGPLSPYFNALWFRVFGESVQTLVAVNLVVLALITWALYWTLSHAASRFSALAATAAFLAGLAFIRTNYNFVAPYSHELTHGILILLVGSRRYSSLPWPSPSDWGSGWPCSGSPGPEFEASQLWRPWGRWFRWRSHTRSWRGGSAQEQH